MEVGTEQQWQAARKELLVAERELEEHARRVEEERRELPWVPVEKEYTFATEGGPKSLLELFEGRSQLLIYHLMFGEDWEVACPGCSSLADGLGGTVVHLNGRDVTLRCMSQAPLEQLVAYKERRGWTVLWVSANRSDFLFDYGYAFRREDMSGVVREEFDMGQLLREAPQWLRDYLYLPLGGNRRGETRTSVNLMLTMLLGGAAPVACMRRNGSPATRV